MSEVSNLLDTLKQLMKEKGVSQPDVAAALGLGIARVKQMFAEKDIRMSRLSIICNELLEIDLSDLMRINEERVSYITSLTEAQEKLLISDMKLLVVAVSVLTNWTAEQIVSRYQITERECQLHLNKLEKFKLISIRDDGHIRFLFDHNFQWIEDGPLERFFTDKIQSDFLNAPFHGAGELRVFRTGMLSEQSVDQLIKLVDKTVAGFIELNRDDSRLPLEQRTGYSMVVALRPWLMPAFTDLLRTS